MKSPTATPLATQSLAPDLGRMSLNPQLEAITPDVVHAARQILVIGAQ